MSGGAGKAWASLVKANVSPNNRSSGSAGYGRERQYGNNKGAGGGSSSGGGGGGIGEGIGGSNTGRLLNSEELAEIQSGLRKLNDVPFE